MSQKFKKILLIVALIGLEIPIYMYTAIDLYMFDIYVYWQVPVDIAAIGHPYTGNFFNPPAAVGLVSLIYHQIPDFLHRVILQEAVFNHSLHAAKFLHMNLTIGVTVWGMGYFLLHGAGKKWRDLLVDEQLQLQLFFASLTFLLSPVFFRTFANGQMGPILLVGVWSLFQFQQTGMEHWGKKLGYGIVGISLLFLKPQAVWGFLIAFLLPVSFSWDKERRKSSLAEGGMSLLLLLTVVGQWVYQAGNVGHGRWLLGDVAVETLRVKGGDLAAIGAIFSFSWWMVVMVVGGSLLLIYLTWGMNGKERLRFPLVLFLPWWMLDYLRAHSLYPALIVGIGESLGRDWSKRYWILGLSLGMWLPYLVAEAQFVYLFLWIGYMVVCSEKKISLPNLISSR